MSEPAGRPGGDYGIRPLLASDEPEVLAVLSAALAGGPAGERSSAFHRWKHTANPFGRSFGLVAHDPRGRDIVGVRLFLRWEFVARGRLVRAVRAVDTATHPAYRGKGIFRGLTTRALGQFDGDGQGVDLVFNTPNAQSLPGYLRMGWLQAGAVPIAIRPIRPLRFARRVHSVAAGTAAAGTAATGTAATGTAARHSTAVSHGAGAGAGTGAAGGARRGARTVTDPGGRSGAAAAARSAAARACRLPAAAGALDDPGLADLVAEVAADEAADRRLATVRSIGFLRWRYADAAVLDYRAITHHGPSGELRGLVLGRPRRRGALLEFTLSELLVRPGDTATAARLLRAAARDCGADHVATTFAPGTPGAAAAMRCGYLMVPGRGMTLVANPRRPLPVDPTALRSWRLSMGDLEVF